MSFVSSLSIAIAVLLCPQATSDTASMDQQLNKVDSTGIDFIHFWFASRIQMQAKIDSIYNREEHEEIHNLCDEFAVQQNSQKIEFPVEQE